MSYLKLPVKDFPDLAKFMSGDNLEVEIKGKVALKMLGGGDDFVTIEVGEYSVEKEEVREHPAEIMKRMLELQGMQSVAQP